MAAAIEQNHDAKGIIWPRALSPFQVLILPVNDQSEKVMITAELIYGTLYEGGIETILDDRSERPGVKFNDADLLGIPYQVIIGEKNLKDGLVELKERDKKTFCSMQIRVSPNEIVHQVREKDTWVTLDTWSQPGANLSLGKFGFYIPGNDQVALSNFSHYAELNPR